jgi:response regulator RpfG family c-di-GMP phosphodiesterase
MLGARRGAVNVLESIKPGSTVEQVCSAVKLEGFAPLSMLGPPHLNAAAESWRLCRLGVVTELLSVIKELSALDSLELLISLGYDLSARPLRPSWSPDHPLRVASIARLLATEGIESAIGRGELRWSALPTASGLEGLWAGALFHDIGKLLIPVEILSKPTMLADAEYLALQEHPAIGHAALSQIAWPWPEVLPIVLHHHEKWNGSGYPGGLAGEEIPWPAQIVALADFCDALMTPRTYRTPFSGEQVRGILESESGTFFNPILVRAMLSVWDRLPGF